MWWPPDSDVVATTSLFGGHHILSGGHQIKKYFLQWYQRGSAPYDTTPSFVLLTRLPVFNFTRATVTMEPHRWLTT